MMLSVRQQWALAIRGRIDWLRRHLGRHLHRESRREFLTSQLIYAYEDLLSLKE